MREGWMRLPVYLAGLCVDGAEIANIFAMEWSTLSFGPDGPWQAVQIQIGSQNSVVSLYPGGSFSSHILAPEVCSFGPSCYAQVAGLYDHKLSSTSAFGNVSYEPRTDYSGGALQMGGVPPTIGTDVWNISSSSGMQTLSGMDMAVHTSIWGTLPDGTTYPLSVGSLGLGAPGTVNQTFGYNDNRPPFNATLLPGWLWAEAPSDKMLKSNSFGLHIGSVSPSIAPSLYFGGFDRNRVLGTVSTQQGVPDADDAIDLLDINLSVASGASPWTFDNLAGLLASGNSSIKGELSVAINPLAPYLHLPKSTCDAIAAQLPVTYQAKYGLYFWNTGDPQYEKIVTSTSFLSFNFRASETANNNLTINVPFKLLNLTLTAPLTSTPTMYFPCKAETQARYQLGRAFLQAAFVGANWNAYDGHAAWWLAQAPGPNMPSQTSVQVIENADTTITGSTDNWASTWKGFWTPLPQANNTGTPSNNPIQSSSSLSTGSIQNSSSLSTGSIQNSPDLSTGAKAGIGVGVCVGAIVAMIGGFLLSIRHRKSLQNATYKSKTFVSTGSPAVNSTLYLNSTFGLAEVDAGETARSELHG